MKFNQQAKLIKSRSKITIANIEINNLDCSGIGLFTDSESFLDRINDVDYNSIFGGGLALFNTDTFFVNDRAILSIRTGPPQSIDCLYLLTKIKK